MSKEEKSTNPFEISDTPGGPAGIHIARDDELSSLVGKLLTYVDATYTDVEQRKAHKKLVKDTIYTWYYDVFDSQHDERSLRGYPVELPR